MEIAKEKLIENNWTEQLKALIPVESCIVADNKYYKSIRTTATRLQKELPVRFKFRTEGDKVKVWKKNI